MAANWLEIATVDVIFKIVVSFVMFLPIYGVLLMWLKGRLGELGTG